MSRSSSVLTAHPTIALRKLIEPAGRFNGKINGVEGKTPFLIGVAGGTASGKSTVCKRIMEKLGQVDMDHTERQVVCISQDSFYRELTAAEKVKAEKGLFNFDHPDAFNDELILQTLKDILAGKKCEIPVYDYRTNSRCDNQFTTIYPADVVLFEGILVFYFPEIRELFHMKLFVDTDSDTRLARRVPRDIKERGRDLDQVLNQYMNFVKPAFEEFCSPAPPYEHEEVDVQEENSSSNDDPQTPAPIPKHPTLSRLTTQHHSKWPQELQHAKQQMDQAFGTLQDIRKDNNDECDLYRK